MKKKVFSLLAVVMFSGSLMSINSSETFSESDPCAEFAWHAADDYCAQRKGGCSSYQLWFFTDVAYSVCIGEI